MLDITSRCSAMKCNATPPPPKEKKSRENSVFTESIFYLNPRLSPKASLWELLWIVWHEGKCRPNKPFCQKNLFTKPGQGYKLAHSTFLLTRRWVQTRFPEIIWCGFNQICQNIMKWINSGFHLYIDRWIHSVVDINYRKIIPQICRTEWNQNKQY